MSLRSFAAGRSTTGSKVKGVKSSQNRTKFFFFGVFPGKNAPAAHAPAGEGKGRGGTREWVVAVEDALTKRQSR